VIGTAQLDHELRIQRPDAAFCTLLGGTADDLAGKSLSALFSPADRVAIESVSRQVMAAQPGTAIEECVGIEWRTTRRYVRLRLVLGSDGWSASIEDALAPDTVLANLVITNQRWKSIMRDASSDCMVFLDANRAIVEHNTRFFELMLFRSPHGVLLNEAALRGRDLFKLWNDPSFDVLEHALAKPRPRDRKFEGTVMFRDRTLMVRLIPNLVPVVGFVGCAIVIRDATDDNLVRMARELAASNAELEQFAYIASHDLQEPLRKVSSFTQLLRRRYGGQLDARADQYIDFAVDGATRMQQLINDLLTFSRVGRGSVDQSTVFGADEALDDALAALAPAIEETGAQIERSPLPRVRGERSLIAAVFQNLVGNAIKFTRAGEAPHVKITSRRDGDHWEFECVDHGIGIDADYAERIFMIFQRLHPKDVYPGTGIGLAMCRKIVEYHGGTIWLAPGDGNGATFRFTLPALSEDEVVKEADVPAG